MNKQSSSEGDIPQIVFVLGGPGSGKGTQCERLVKEFGFVHISTGDLFRAEAKLGTPEGNTIKELMAKGEFVPSALTVKLLLKAIKSRSAKRYLIDGFPRTLEQAQEFEKSFGREIDFVLNFETAENVLTDRLMERSRTSGREDDNPETIRKRIQVFNTETKPVLNYYSGIGKVRNVDASGHLDTVYGLTTQAIAPNVICVTGAPTPSLQELSKKLADHLGYKFVDANEFWRGAKVADKLDDAKVNALYDHLNTHPSRNFVVNGFPANETQTNKFLNPNVNALKVFLVEGPSEKDILDDLEKFPTKELVAEHKHLNAAFGRELEKLKISLGGRPNYAIIDGRKSAPEVVDAMVKSLNIKLVLLDRGNNEKTYKEYLHILTAKEGYRLVDIPALCKQESDRGKSSDQSDTAAIQCAKTAIFSNPGCKKFLLVGHIKTKAQLVAFEAGVTEIQWLLHCATAADVKLDDDLTATFKTRSRLQIVVNVNDRQLNLLEGREQPPREYKAGPLHQEYVEPDEDNGRLAVKSDQKPQVIFVLGGPGSGKGTQCERLVKDFRYTHISTGDLFRAEIKAGTPEGVKIKDMVDKGQIVPPDVTIKILMKAIRSSNSKKFLIDGFPRSLDQALELEKSFREIDFVLNYDVSDDILVNRLLERGKTSGRADDNEATIKERIRVFNTQTRPVLDYYSHAGKVRNVSALGSVEDVYQRTLAALAPNVMCLFGPPTTKRFDLANKLSSHLGYKLIDVDEYWKDLRMSFKSDKLKVESLFNYMRDNSEHSFVLNSFPANEAQAKLMFEGDRVRPLRVYHVDVSDAEVQADINSLSSTDQKIEFRQMYSAFQHYVPQLVRYLSAKHWFSTIHAGHHRGTQALIHHILKDFQFSVIKVEKGDNPALFNEYIAEMESKKGWMHLSHNAMIDREIARGTELGKKLAEAKKNGKIPTDLHHKLLRKLIYAYPDNKRIMISDYLNDRESLTHFEREIAPVDCYVFCSKDAHYKSDHGKDQMIANFESRNRLLPINVADLNSVERLMLKLADDNQAHHHKHEHKKENKAQIIYVLGGPGSGKGTQCEKLVRDYKFTHISIGDLMRAEIKSGSPEGLAIKEKVENGQIVETAVTIRLLMKAINAGSSKKYLIDGFPRGLEQALELEKTFREIDFILNFDAPAEVLVDRLLERGKTSGRADDEIDTIKKRIDTFNEMTRPVLDYYWRFGKVRNVSSVGDVNEVYERVVNALKPTLICLYGPPVKTRKKVGKKLAKRLDYEFLDVDKFWQSRGLTSKGDETKTTQLLEFLRDSPRRNFILNSFPQTKQQALILFEHYAKPFRVYYFDTPKDEVQQYINKKKKSDRKVLRQDVYNTFLNNRAGLLEFFKGQQYFVRLDGSKSKKEVFNTLFDADFKPTILRAYRGENEALHDDFLADLETRKGFIGLPFNLLVEREIERNTDLGKQLHHQEQSQAAHHHKKGHAGHLTRLYMKLLRKVMFRNVENKRFYISDYPNDVEEYNDFNRKVSQIDHVLYFTQGGEGRSASPLPLFRDMNALTQSFVDGKLIFVDKGDVNLLDKYIEKQLNYGIIVGPPAAGKTLICKHLAKKFNFKLINIDETVEYLKKALSKDDQPLDDVPMIEVFNYLKKKLTELSAAGETAIFDSFGGANVTYGIPEFKKFLEVVGAPAFAINLKVNKDTVINRVKIVKEIQGDLPEDEAEAIDKGIAKGAEMAQSLNDLAAVTLNMNFFNVEANMTFSTLVQSINFLFSKRVLLFRSPAVSTKYNFTPFPLFATICARMGVIPIHVPELLHKRLHDYHSIRASSDELGAALAREVAIGQVFDHSKKHGTISPGLFPPKLVCRVILDHLRAIKSDASVVMLYEYPAADTAKHVHQSLQVNNAMQLTFPRALDELSAIEDLIGEIKMVVNFSGTQEYTNLNNPMEEPPKPVKKEEKKVVEGEEGDEDKKDDKPADDDEEGKPKFDPTQFKWSRIDIAPKTVGQIFNKMKRPLKVCQNLDMRNDEEIENMIVGLVTQIGETDQNIYAELLV